MSHMEALLYWLALAAAVWVGWSVAEWLWLRPRRLERKLREQGFRGTKYRFPNGDLTDHANLLLEACRNPMPFSHRIVDRVIPNFKSVVDLYGGKEKAPVYYWLGPVPRVIIRDLELIKDILSSKFVHFEKLSSSSIGRLLQGLLAYDGPKWAKHRRIINPAFHVEKLKLMMPAFSTCCDELIIRWEDLTENTSEIDIWQELKNFAGNIISRAAFGSNYREGRRIFELLLEQTVLAVQETRSLNIPGFRFIPTPKNKRSKKIHKEVVTLLKSMIEQREYLMKNNKVGSDDLLGLLIESNQRHVEEGNHHQDASLTKEDVIKECKLFYIAGQETIAVLLTWAIIALSMHQNWQDQARKEVMDVFGQNKPTFEGLSRLKIVTMILYEVLRLYPPLVTLFRQINKEIKLREFNLPAGVQLVIPIIILHHRQELWGEDAEEFNPGRFTDGVSNATKNQLIFFPFGWGPRICIGQNFALIEAKMALARILQRFSVELSPSYAHAPCVVLTLQPQHGAQVILHKLPVL